MDGAMLLGGTFGASIGDLIFGLLILKFGPKDKKQNYIAQAVILTFFSVWMTFDKRSRPDEYVHDVCNWLGLLIMLLGMGYYLFIKPEKKK